jgi:hypothetical protein
MTGDGTQIPRDSKLNTRFLRNVAGEIAGEDRLPGSLGLWPMAGDAAYLILYHVVIARLPTRPTT